MLDYYYMTDAPTGNLTILRLEGNLLTSFTENLDNADWRAYQEWLAEGNTPEPWPPAE